ncbi:MAG TPA: elongation factor P hydroxylase [Pseudomonadales bacterium]
MAHRWIAGRFNARFGRRAGVLLVGGAAEPLYTPGSGRYPALIRYTHDYARSALHEIAHWLLARPDRRRLVDYGLWYRPPPRSAAEQARFYAAEVPVQALEMLLSEAAGVPFRFSADNPGIDHDTARLSFESRVRARFLELCRRATGRGAPLPEETAAALDALNPAWRGALGERLRDAEREPTETR